jgi:small subunit ribosomal protein S6
VNTYETLFIVNPEIGDGEITKSIEIIQDVITSGGGTILKIDKWGRRQLAYEIQKKREGFYVLMYFQAPTEVLPELNRRYKLTDTILRNLILQLGKDQRADLLESIEAAKDSEPMPTPPPAEAGGDEQEAATEESEEQKPDTDTEDE